MPDFGFLQRLAQLNNPMMQGQSPRTPAFNPNEPEPLYLPNQIPRRPLPQLPPQPQGMEIPDFTSSGPQMPSMYSNDPLQKPIPRNIQNPMLNGGTVQRINPYKQQRTMTDLPETSGTGAVRRQTGARTMVDRIKENVAKDVRYEDIAPKMEQMPDTPAFQPKPVHGFVGRLKSALQGAGSYYRLNQGNPLAALVGGIGGAINPEAAQRNAYQAFTLPQVQQQQMGVAQRNKMRMDQFDQEIKGRTAVAKLNEANAPDYAMGNAGEYPVLYNKKDANDYQMVYDDQGNPMKNASVVNTQRRTESAEEIARDRDNLRAQLEVEKSGRALDKAKYDWEQRQIIEKMRQAGQEHRLGITEENKNKRLDKSEEGKNARSKTLRPKPTPNDDGTDLPPDPVGGRTMRNGLEYKTKDKRPQQATYENQFGPKGKDSKPGFPVYTDVPSGVGDYGPAAPTSGTGNTDSKKKKRPELPPTSGTGPN